MQNVSNIYSSIHFKLSKLGLIHQHIGREQQMNTYARQLASATQRVGKKAKEIANILNAIKRMLCVCVCRILQTNLSLLLLIDWIENCRTYDCLHGADAQKAARFYWRHFEGIRVDTFLRWNDYDFGAWQHRKAAVRGAHTFQGNNCFVIFSSEYGMDGSPTNSTLTDRSQDASYAEFCHSIQGAEESLHDGHTPHEWDGDNDAHRRSDAELTETRINGWAGRNRIESNWFHLFLSRISSNFNFISKLSMV